MEEEPEVVAEVTEQFLQTATPGDGFVEIQTVDFDVVPGEAQIIGQVRMRRVFYLTLKPALPWLPRIFVF